MTTNSAARAWLVREYRQNRRSAFALLAAMKPLIRAGEYDAAAGIGDRLVVVCERCAALRRAIAQLDSPMVAALSLGGGRQLRLVAVGNSTQH